jgi:hypothetical protein
LYQQGIHEPAAKTFVQEQSAKRFANHESATLQQQQVGNSIPKYKQDTS